MKKNKASLWWGLILFIAAIVAIIIGYNLGIEKVNEEVLDIRTKEEKTPSADETLSQDEQEILSAKESMTIMNIEKPSLLPEKEPCNQQKDQMREFFDYLNKLDYINNIEKDTDTYDHFKVILNRMKAHLPVPAGESITQEIMSANIFHFFRIFKKNDLKLIKMILNREEETLEMNLDIFYRWLSPESKCPDPDNLKPSLKEIYHYAGFLLNTIGGRAYTFRRTLEQRVLLHYYCMLVMYQADIKGENSYGIDIYPWIAPLITEIEILPYLQYRESYLDQLITIQDYYKGRMKPQG